MSPSRTGDVTILDFAELSSRERYKVMIGTIVPRPIAWVTTKDPEGRVNAAPFSFFGCLSSDPPIIGLGIEFRPDGPPKDTGLNIQKTGVFTVNIVSSALVDGMNVCAVPFAAGVDELAKAGLTTRPGRHIDVPSIAEAPASLECRLHSFLPIGESRQIVLGEIVGAQFHSNVIDERFHVDPVLLDAVGRMGGHGYATTRDYFDVPTMSEETFRTASLQNSDAR